MRALETALLGGPMLAVRLQEVRYEYEATVRPIIRNYADFLALYARPFIIRRGDYLMANFAG